MKRKCFRCLSGSTVQHNCPDGNDANRVIRRSTLEDQLEAVRDRMHGYRTFAGQLQRLCREQSVTIPPDVATLNPDHG